MNPEMIQTEKIFASNSEDETRLIGFRLGKNITAGLTVLLYGDLGTGKTVFIRGVGEAMNITGVRSPSFTLINEYKSDSGLYLIHSDLYRLDDEGVYALGLDEYVNSSDSVLFVEWPERWNNIPVNDVIKIYFTAINEDERRIKIYAHGKKAQEVIEKL